MPQYSLLRRHIPKADLPRVVAGLQRLIAQLDRDIPSKDSELNLLLATWNIRDFGKINRRGYGDRIPETHFYIAEIISRFDFVAVQEVNELDEWYRVMDVLGPNWDFIATDIAHSALGSNGERLLYAFDKRKVWFQKIAGEIVLPAKMLITDAPEGQKPDEFRGKQFRRTPFMARFQSGWFKYDICTVHIYYGEDSGAALRERVAEIDRVAAYLADLAKAKAKKDGRATILLGDFNIVSPEHETMKALKKHGFATAKRLDRPSNLNRTKYYDQIAFPAEPDVLAYVDKDTPGVANAGIFELYESVFRDGGTPDGDVDAAAFADAARRSPNGRAKTGADLTAYYEDWKTYQLSDHKPMWVRLKSDKAAAYLAGLVAPPP